MRRRNLLAMAALGLVVGSGGAEAQSPIPNDPFLSVPAPAPRPIPRPPQAAPRPAAAPAPAPAASYPVAVGQSFRDCGDCPEMVVIPAGRFTMGSPASESGRDSDEGPEREVFLRSSLAVGKFEVTFGEWDVCVSGGGCSHRPADQGWGRGRQPVMNVSWEDAQQYVRWLSGRTGRTYRLLTEAEWEYAARAGTSTAYSFGASISPSQANYADVRLGRTQAVGSYGANGWGLHDMHGNVSEWAEDCHGSYWDAPTDGSRAITTGNCTARVLRGGSWDLLPQNLRAANRNRSAPGLRLSIIGFRLARTPG